MDNARRPPRRMPSLWVIADYWHNRPDVLELDPEGIEAPYCFGCYIEAPYDLELPLKDRWRRANRCLQRAHLVDRCVGGLDGPQNIVPLCAFCHRHMPAFGVGQGPAAMAWVIAGGCLQGTGYAGSRPFAVTS